LSIYLDTSVLVGLFVSHDSLATSRLNVPVATFDRGMAACAAALGIALQNV